jgi:D-glycero-D-manno-heptose 1,7-bisphosphate phosphatase
MTSVDQVFTQAHKISPFLVAILDAVIDGGKLVASGSGSQEFFSDLKDLLSVEHIPMDNVSGFRRLGDRDLLFVVGSSVENLVKINALTGCQVVSISNVDIDTSLSDYQLNENEFRKSLAQIPSLVSVALGLYARSDFELSYLNKALFLDRDGVVVKDIHYLHDPQQVELNPGLVSTLRRARHQGFKLFVVTNQSGLGREMYSFEQYDQVTERMQELLAAEGLFFDRILKSSYYEGSVRSFGLRKKSWRKPRPGMIHSLAREYSIDLSQSLMVGDTATDLMAAALAQVGKIFLLQSHRTPVESDKWDFWLSATGLHSKVKAAKISSLEEIFA